jgi:hypothetical protein
MMSNTHALPAGLILITPFSLFDFTVVRVLASDDEARHDYFNDGYSNDDDQEVDDNYDNFFPAEKNACDFYRMEDGPIDHSLVIEYAYQMEYKTSLSSSTLISLIGGVEHGIGEEILRSTFPECSLASMIEVQEEVIGLSNKPRDEPNNTYICGIDIDSSAHTECQVIDGRLTLYLSDSLNTTNRTTLDAIKLANQKIIERVMQSGEIISRYPDIISIEYGVINSTTIREKETDPVGQANANVYQMPAYGSTIIGVLSTLFVVFSAAGYSAYSEMREAEARDESGEQSTTMSIESNDGVVLLESDTWT